MANLQDELRQTLTNRGLAGETPADNQKKAFKKVAECIEALEERVAALEKQLEEAGRIQL
jgi:archaellum component FlaC